MRSSTPSSPFRHRGMVMLLLSLFLFGSNYCVLAAAASATPAASRLACHPAPDRATSANHGCCDRPADPSDATPRASYPCCIRVAPHAVAGVDVLAAGAAIALATEAEIGLLPPTVSWFPRVENAGESPPDPPLAIPRGRAPPTAS